MAWVPSGAFVAGSLVVVGVQRISVAPSTVRKANRLVFHEMETRMASSLGFFLDSMRGV
jgi:hypothetical protein